MSCHFENHEIYEHVCGMRKPQISRRMEKEHKAICRSIINLEADLEDAIAQRNELEEERQDREFIDHNVASAWEWIVCHSESQHPWKTHKNIIANLKSRLYNMNLCSCCSRHMTDRPTCDDICNKIVYPPKSQLNPDKLKSALEVCDCQCRQTARIIHKRLYQLNSQPLDVETI
tara:strand:- start:6 stop:527 length:522 start_codon:yes stop_codon:yes gene_type:complete